MKIVHGCCAGADVHKKVLVVCLRKKGHKWIRKCGTTTKELQEMAQWLLAKDCECIAMESTGSYWQPIMNVFEDAGLDVIVVNPRNMKNIPGKKTDQADADWICDLLRHGLLQASYIPDKRRRELREAEQRLQSLKQASTAEKNRLQKTLEGCNIKISGTLSDIMGMSGRTLLEEYLDTGILTVERIRQLQDEGKVSKQLHATNEQIALDFEGSMSPLKRKLLKSILGSIDNLDRQISELRQAIAAELTSEELEAIDAITVIPGVGLESGRIIIDTLGPNLDEFSSAGKISSWGGVAPGNNESAGKRYSSRTTKGNKLFKTTLVQCAQAAVRKKDSFLKAKFERLRIRCGYKKAIMAIAHTILRSIWYILHEGIVYEDLGADYYDKHNRRSKINQAVKKLMHLGVHADLLAPIKETILTA